MTIANRIVCAKLGLTETKKFNNKDQVKFKSYYVVNVGIDFY